MSLLLVFMLLALIGQIGNAMIAMALDRYSETASLAVFFVLLVVIFVAAWKLAVWLTEPKAERQRHEHAAG